MSDTTSLSSTSISNVNLLEGSYVADCVFFIHIGLHILVVWALFSVISTCDPEEGRFNVWNQSFTEGDAGKTAVFHSFFPCVLEVAQSDYTRRDSTALGVILTLPRIDRIFIHLPMAEARDFHCSSHFVENLGKETVPSDHAAVRFVILKPTNPGHQSKRIASWMSKHPIFLIHIAAAS